MFGKTSKMKFISEKKGLRPKRGVRLSNRLRVHALNFSQPFLSRYRVNRKSLNAFALYYFSPFLPQESGKSTFLSVKKFFKTHSVNVFNRYLTSRTNRIYPFIPNLQKDIKAPATSAKDGKDTRLALPYLSPLVKPGNKKQKPNPKTILSAINTHNKPSNRLKAQEFSIIRRIISEEKSKKTVSPFHTKPLERLLLKKTGVFNGDPLQSGTKQPSTDIREIVQSPQAKDNQNNVTHKPSLNPGYDSQTSNTGFAGSTQQNDRLSPTSKQVKPTTSGLPLKAAFSPLAAAHHSFTLPGKEHITPVRERNTIRFKEESSFPRPGSIKQTSTKIVTSPVRSTIQKLIKNLYSSTESRQTINRTELIKPRPVPQHVNTSKPVSTGSVNRQDRNQRVTAIQETNKAYQLPVQLIPVGSRFKQEKHEARQMIQNALKERPVLDNREFIISARNPKTAEFPKASLTPAAVPMMETTIDSKSNQADQRKTIISGKGIRKAKTATTLPRKGTTISERQGSPLKKPTMATNQGGTLAMDKVNLHHIESISNTNHAKHIIQTFQNYYSNLQVIEGLTAGRNIGHEDDKEPGFKVPMGQRRVPQPIIRRKNFNPNPVRLKQSQNIRDFSTHSREMNRSITNYLSNIQTKAIQFAELPGTQSVFMDKETSIEKKPDHSTTNTSFMAPRNNMIHRQLPRFATDNSKPANREKIKDFEELPALSYVENHNHQETIGSEPDHSIQSVNQTVDPEKLTENIVHEYFRNEPVNTINLVAEQVYDLIEKRILIEQDRRGWI